MQERRLPSSFYNWISAIGALVAVVSFSVILLLLLIDLYVQETTLYLGLLTFLILPVFLVMGLGMIAAGAVREKSLIAKGTQSRFPRQFRIDLENPSHRNAIVIWSVGTAIFLLGTSVGSYKAYKATESTEFCGELCHAVMSPEFTAYQVSPHARVECVSCHIGPGAQWFVQAKLSGLRQVYHTIMSDYDRPIETPITNLRPARETCQKCHWPEQFFGARKDVNPHFLSDEENTPHPITMLINIGGGSEALGQKEGIHWHMANANVTEYAAYDETRESIAWIRVTQPDGKEKVFVNTEDPLSEEELAEREIRTMDCIDCHNRPSHVYRSPIKAVNQAMAIGWIDRDLPFIKREAVTVLDQDFETTEQAFIEIERHLKGFYQEEYPQILIDRAAGVTASIDAVKRIFGQNFFPEMKVNWKQYPDHIGHSEFPGCFRCHGDAFETAEGETITADCNACHIILSQGSGEQAAMISPSGLPFQHPIDIEGAELEGLCTECHEGGSELY